MSKSLRFAGYKATVSIGRYHDGNTRLQLWCSDGPLATASVNPDGPLAENEVAIKNYAENAGILDVLVNAGVVSAPIRTVRAGCMTVPVCTLL
jgi:hypothetical protein